MMRILQEQTNSTYNTEIDTQTDWDVDNRRSLAQVLKLVNENFKIDWYVQELPETAFRQKVNIHFLNKKSGILSEQIDLINRKELSETNYITHQGYIGYCQSDNGNIQVIFGYPGNRFELLKKHKKIAEYDPTYITENLISRHIQLFLNELSNQAY